MNRPSDQLLLRLPRIASPAVLRRLILGCVVGFLSIIVACSTGQSGGVDMTTYRDGNRVVATAKVLVGSPADRVFAAILTSGRAARDARVSINRRRVGTEKADEETASQMVALAEQKLGVNANDFEFQVVRQTKKEDVAVETGNVVTASINIQGVTGQVVVVIATEGQLESGTPAFEDEQFVIIDLDPLPETAKKELKQVDQQRTVTLEQVGTAFIATHDLVVTFENVSKDTVLHNPFFLTKDNFPATATLLNADGGPGGPGTTLTPVGNNGTSDGRIEPGERFEVEFVVEKKGDSARMASTFPKNAKKLWLPLNFRVDLLPGTPTPAATGTPGPTPTNAPTATPATTPTAAPTNTPTPTTTATPSPSPTATPTPAVTPAPTAVPTATPTPAPTATAPPFACSGVNAIPDPNEPAFGHVFDGGDCNQSMAELLFVVLGTSYTSFTIPMPQGEFATTNQPNDTIVGTNPNPATNPKKKIQGAKFTTAGSNPVTVQVTAKDATGATSVHTVTIPGPGLVLKGVLTPTTGRFNYNLALGIPGADAACNTNYPGTHACELAELQSAEASGDLGGIRDAGGTTVTSFWGIDPGRGGPEQCWDGVASSYTYQTAHLAWSGVSRSLNNATGTLGPVQSPTLCSESHWVGCCQ